jgi:4-diphosphocytidyl-2-C-methyl-D-erythritol kinase
MGGGSADAAATLRLLDALHPDGPLGWERLLDAAAQVGADVPFLVTLSPMAFAWGRGTRLMPLPALPQRHVALLFPPFGIGTATAYAAVDRHERPATPLALDPTSLATWSHELAPPPSRWREGNDFVAALDADLSRMAHRAMAALERAGAVTGGMTGSGSTLFGIFDAAPDARALERDAGVPVVLTRTAIAVERPTVTE